MDIDIDAINIFKSNLVEMELDDSSYDIVNCDILNLAGNIESTKYYKAFDTVITNPPFGTAHSQKGNI